MFAVRSLCLTKCIFYLDGTCIVEMCSHALVVSSFLVAASVRGHRRDECTGNSTLAVLNGTKVRCRIGWVTRRASYVHSRWIQFTEFVVEGHKPGRVRVFVRVPAGCCWDSSCSPTARPASGGGTKLKCTHALPINRSYRSRRRSRSRRMRR